MGITMWIWICAGLAVLCFALFLLLSSMNFVHQAKPKQSLVKQSMFSWLLLVMCGGWVAVAILLNIALQTQLT
ncbi:hypothetical protein H5O55_002001 [Enterococcus faecalis]|nr:hypothetical protein [Enterococcus faecalis]EIY5760787.1 hypothetical protein [Enterococcus faecalis]